MWKRAMNACERRRMQVKSAFGAKSREKEISVVIYFSRT
jgi:hypothetical protein